MAPPSNEQLYTAIKHNDIESAKIALENGADPNAVFESRQKPAISLAITTNNDKPMVELLLKQPNIDINKPDKRKFTPLMYTCLGRGRIEILKLLLKHGAKTDLIDLNGYTALDVAKQEKSNVDSVEAIELLKPSALLSPLSRGTRAGMLRVLNSYTPEEREAAIARLSPKSRSLYDMEGGGRRKKRCKSGFRRSRRTKRCVKKCKTGFRRNARTHRCRKAI